MSLRSEITRVVLVNRLRLKIPPNFWAHSVNLVSCLAHTETIPQFHRRITVGVSQQLVSDAHSQGLVL